MLHSRSLSCFTINIQPDCHSNNSVLGTAVVTRGTLQTQKLRPAKSFMKVKMCA